MAEKVFPDIDKHEIAAKLNVTATQLEVALFRRMMKELADDEDSWRAMVAGWDWGNIERSLGLEKVGLNVDVAEYDRLLKERFDEARRLRAERQAAAEEERRRRHVHGPLKVDDVPDEPDERPIEARRDEPQEGNPPNIEWRAPTPQESGARVEEEFKVEVSSGSTKMPSLKSIGEVADKYAGSSRGLPPRLVSFLYDILNNEIPIGRLLLWVQAADHLKESPGRYDNETMLALARDAARRLMQ